MRFRFSQIILLLSLAITTCCYAKSPILYQWKELGPDNQLITRVVTSAKICPKGMDIFSSITPDFPYLVCQKITPHYKFDPKRIVIIGDTGCRVKKGSFIQDCNNPYQWPFSFVAKSAAAWKPDLVIHEGDYYYRESACPPGNAGCEGDPHGDNWGAWNADFFKPAKPLLESAPWIVVRGNHETCDRGGEGWTRLLDPFSFKRCHTHSPLYSVDLGHTRLFILDSSSASDFVAPTDQVDWYSEYLRHVKNSNAQHNWLLTHKPFWFVFSNQTLVKTLQSNFINTLQASWLNVSPDNVDLILSGHLHRFQTVNFGATRPSQIIVGDSGTLLDPTFNRQDLSGFKVAGMTVSSGEALSSFGFMTLEKQKDGWHAQLRDPFGKILSNCTFDKDNQIQCKETPLGLEKSRNDIH